MVRNYIILVLFLLLTGYSLHAQADSPQQLLFDQIYAAAESEYGIDQELINGPLFENRNSGVSGLPYLLNYYTNQGSVIYRGKHYSNLNLRYDLYNQQVLLIYIFDAVEYKIHLQKELITEFRIEDKKFINEAYGTNGETKYFQVIGQDFPIRILYFWQKGLNNVYVNNPDIKKYSTEQKETFVLLHNKLEMYSGNRSFVRIFTPEKKTAVKDYLRKSNIKVSQSNDEEMELLIEFINTLEN